VDCRAARICAIAGLATFGSPNDIDMARNGSRRGFDVIYR